MTPVNVHLHWVCPGAAVGELPSVCPSTDFTVTVTYGNSSAGKITFNPSEIFGPAPSDYNGSTAAALAPCPRGYLIGWAVDKFDNPIVFNGLLGDAVLRSTGTDLQSYKAITIQANGNELAPVSLGNGGWSSTALPATIRRSPGRSRPTSPSIAIRLLPSTTSP